MRGHLVQLVAVVLLLLCGSAEAGFASYARPAGVSGTGADLRYGGSAANAPFVNGSAAGAVTAPVAGRTVTVPVGMRLAANAASFAVGAIRLNPAGLAAGAVAAWLATYGLSYLNGQWNKAGQCWVTAYYPANCYDSAGEAAQAGLVAISAQQGGEAYTVTFCVASCTQLAQSWSVCRASGYCRTNQGVSSSGQTINRPAVEADFAAASSASTIPDGAANQLKVDVPLPVSVVPNPDANGQAQTYRAIASSPYAVPDTSPTQYKQDVVDLRPAATTSDPLAYEFVPGTIDLGANSSGVVDGTPTSSSTPLEKIEVRTCGLPDSAPCKIDETGTPAAEAADQAAVNAAETALLGQITGLSSKPAPAWTFSFALPSGCSVIALPAFAPYLSGIDVCQYQPMIHDLMSMIWLGLTAFGIIGMVSRTLIGESA